MVVRTKMLLIMDTGLEKKEVHGKQEGRIKKI